jgi:hypothetical protein
MSNRSKDQAAVAADGCYLLPIVDKFPPQYTVSYPIRQQSLYTCTFKLSYEIVIFLHVDIQDVPGGKGDIQGGHSIDDTKQEIVYVHIPVSKMLPR